MANTGIGYTLSTYIILWASVYGKDKKETKKFRF